MAYCFRILLSCAALFSVLAAPTTYQANDKNIYYSPFAWHVTDSSASTINSASYCRFLFSGSMLNFKFDVSDMVTPASEVYWTVDNGPKTLSLVMDTVSVVIPSNNTANTVPYHTIELFVKSTTERANRWKATGNGTRIMLTGIETDGKLAPWVPSDINVLVYGDSITEGVMTLGGSQKFDTDHNDASVVYSYVLGGLLGAEIGVIGFGADAVTHGGSGGAAELGISWDQLWDGVPRSFDSPKPDLIVINYGTNDGCDTTKVGCVGTDITAKMATILGNLSTACPSVPIAVMEPFNLGQSAHLKAAIAAAATTDAHYIEATNAAGAPFYDLTYGGSLHPTGMNDIAQIAPQLASKLRPLLYKSVLARMAAADAF